MPKGTRQQKCGLNYSHHLDPNPNLMLVHSSMNSHWAKWSYWFAISNLTIFSAASVTILFY